MIPRDVSAMRGRSAGFTLVEVMVTLVVLSIGLLGLGGLQLVGVQNTQGAYQRTQAAFLASDIIDRMRGNPVATVAGDYDLGLAEDASGFALCFGAAADCSPLELARHDLRSWRSALDNYLGAGNGTVQTAALATGGTQVDVTIQWLDNRSRDEGGGNVEPEQLTVRAIL